MKYLSFGSNPFMFVGLSYSKCNAILAKSPSRKGRPLVTLHLLFLVVWLELPFRHVSEDGHGTAMESWGLVFHTKRFRFHVKNGYKVNFFGL